MKMALVPASSEVQGPTQSTALAVPSSPPAINGTSTNLESDSKQQIPGGEQGFPTSTLSMSNQESEVKNFEVVDKTTAQVGGTTVHAVTGISTQVENRVQEEMQFSIGEHGIYAQKVIHRQQIVRQVIYRNLYVEATRGRQTGVVAIQQVEDDSVEATCAEHCIDACCQTCVCDFSTNPFKGRKNHHAIKSKEIMNKYLRRGRAKGWGMFRSITCPLLTDVVRDSWVSVQLVSALIVMGLSIAAMALNETRLFNFVFLAFAILYGMFASFDAIFTLKSCRSCRQYREAKKMREKGNIYRIDDPNFIESYATKGEEGNEETGEEDEGKKVKKCKCCSCCRSACDILRVIFTEIFIYPLLICGMFEAIVGQGYEGKSHGDRIAFAAFLLSCVSLLAYVYVARIVIVVKIIQNVRNTRKPNPELLEKAGSKSRYNPTISRSAMVHQVYFLVHLILQMLAQVMMLIAIGGKIRYDNRHFYSRSNTVQSGFFSPSRFSFGITTDPNPLLNTDQVYVSSHLAYMMAMGYVLPVAGIFSFFIVTFYWVQEFPVGLCLDIVSIMEMESDAIPIGSTTMEERLKLPNLVEVINQFVNIDMLVEEFNILRSTTFGDKFSYPFKTPMLVVLCMGYGLLQLAFVICAAVTMDDMGVIISQILNGGGWIIYYIVAVVVGVIANLYVFLVAAFWTAIIVGILLAIAMMIIAICCCIVAAGSTNNNN